MYNLIEYSKYYSDTLGNLQLLKRDKAPTNNANVTINANVTKCN